MAQLLEWVEEEVEPHLPPDVAQDFKGQLRAKLNALATDACEMLELQPGEQINGLVLEQRNKLSATGHRG